MPEEFQLVTRDRLEGRGTASREAMVGLTDSNRAAAPGRPRPPRGPTFNDRHLRHCGHARLNDRYGLPSNLVLSGNEHDQCSRSRCRCSLDHIPSCLRSWLLISRALLAPLSPSRRSTPGSAPCGRPHSHSMSRAAPAAITLKCSGRGSGTKTIRNRDSSGFDNGLNMFAVAQNIILLRSHGV